MVNHVDPQVFKDMTQEVKEFLTGSDKKIVNELEAKMMVSSDNMEFEQAAEYRDVIKAIGTLRTKQRVMNQDLKDRDVFGYYVDKGWMWSVR